MTGTFSSGFALGFGLILAIGAQNAFVLRQGLAREHVFWTCLTCAVSDAILIAAGVTGTGALATRWASFETVMRYGGAAFLIWYGARNLHSAWRGGAMLNATNKARTSLSATLTTVLALTWLNPHVYLDTAVLIGSVSAQYDNRLWFGLGAGASSFVFFFGLGFGARFLAPVFARPQAWQVLDIVIGLTMWVIAIRLLYM